MVPTVPKKKKPLARPVYLPEEKWRELDEIARFEEEAFRLAGGEQSVSRNDVITAHLDWSIEKFWEDKGGRPQTQEEFLQKAREHAARRALEK